MYIDHFRIYNGCRTLFFTGEIFELKAELNNEKKEKRKEAVKKVIAAMTVGKDVRYMKYINSCLSIGEL